MQSRANAGLLLLLAAIASGCGVRFPAAEQSSRCSPPDGVSGSPRSIEAALALVNALPHPATVPCFLESLDRPLHVHANRSFQSLQPSIGDRSPRIFVFFDPLYMSVVPAGSGVDFLELGVLDEHFRSTKAEIEFPVMEVLPADEPYRRILNLGSDAKVYGTVCASCHSFEQPSESIANAFTSTAYRPEPGLDDVSLGFLSKQAQSCDRSSEPERCDILSAIFRGEVISHAFSDQMATFSSH